MGEKRTAPEQAVYELLVEATCTSPDVRLEDHEIDPLRVRVDGIVSVRAVVDAILSDAVLQIKHELDIEREKRAVTQGVLDEVTLEAAEGLDEFLQGDKTPPEVQEREIEQGKRSTFAGPQWALSLHWALYHFMQDDKHFLPEPPEEMKEAALNVVRLLNLESEKRRSGRPLGSFRFKL